MTFTGQSIKSPVASIIWECETIKENRESAEVWLIKEVLKMSYSETAEELNKTPAYAIYHYNKAEKLRVEDWLFRTITSEIRAKFLEL